MADALYLVFAIIAGIGFTYAFNKTLAADLLDDEDEFFDFVLNGFMRLMVFLLGFAWPFTVPIAALFGGLYWYWNYKKTKRRNFKINSF